MLKLNIAQHRGGFTIDNEDGTKEYAFLEDREIAHHLVNSANRCEILEKKPLSIVKATDGAAGFFIGPTLITAEDPCVNPSVEMVARNTASALGLPLSRLALDVSVLDEWGFEDMLEIAQEQAKKPHSGASFEM